MTNKECKIVSNYMFDLQVAITFHDKLKEIMIKRDYVSGILFIQNTHTLINTIYKIRDLERSRFVTDKIQLGIANDDFKLIKTLRNKIFHGDLDGIRDDLPTANTLLKLANRIYNTLYDQLTPSVKLKLDLDLDDMRRELEAEFYNYFRKREDIHGK